MKKLEPQLYIPVVVSLRETRSMKKIHP